MPVEMCSIGGYSETGKNCTAIKVDDEVVIFDMGLHMENYIRYTENEDIRALSYQELRKVDAIPDLSLIEDWQDKVIAIVPSHAHLDHVGAVPFASKKCPNASIIGTPYTVEVLRSILKDERIDIPNPIIDLNLNATYKLSPNLTLELINVTHSVPQASLIALHTKYGTIIYANDYKFDRQPTLGKKPNFKRLKELGDKKVLALICESLYAHEHKKTPSESVAKQMLKDVLLGVNSKGRALIVTTFSSHLARLKSIIEMGKQLNRKIVFLGRSLAKYVDAGEKINIINFKKDVKVIKYRDQIEHFLKKISKQKDKYLIAVTGHQGEPRAILPRIARRELKLDLGSGDLVIFSCSVIPVTLNKDNREVLEKQLRDRHVRIFRDIHVSGHACREDHRDLFELVRPKHIIPSHAGHEKAMHLAELAEEMGYKMEKTIHLMEDGKRIKLN
ncbi:RNase J family beta-CASP ribonuclease [Candidatus Woesearchaeota archaeon]|nr:RNase J family beta-CASP ribonuclease [Candidatus Woesearchaeota archaeon]